MHIPASPQGYQSFGGDQLGPCQSLHLLGGYQSLGGNQLDPCQFQCHPEVTNPLEMINWVHADPYITLGVTNLMGAINWINVDPNTPRLPIF